VTSQAEKELTQDAKSLADIRAKNKRIKLKALELRRVSLKRLEAERKLPQTLILINFNAIVIGIIVYMLAIALSQYAPLYSETLGPELAQLVLFFAPPIAFFSSLLWMLRSLPDNWLRLVAEHMNTEQYVAPSSKWGGALDAHYLDMKFRQSDPSTAIKTETDTSSRHEGNGANNIASTAVNLQTEPSELSAEIEDRDSGEDEPPGSAAPQTLSSDEERRLAEIAETAAIEFDKFAGTALNALDHDTQLAGPLGFAMQLYLMGACIALAQRNSLSAQQTASILVRANKIFLNVPKEDSESLALNYEHYIKLDDYREIANAGALAMRAQVDGDEAAASSMIERYDRFSEYPVTAPTTMTLLISDIMDASELVQSLGNLHAMRVVKAHDQAVQHARSKYKGKKIQNNRDGIVLAFTNPADAIEAGQAIQEMIARQNKDSLALTANVRIGINIGAVIQEAGSIIGATLIHAAMACNMAASGTVAVTGTVKSSYSKSDYKFKRIGQLELSELGRNRPVYAVMPIENKLEYIEIGHKAATRRRHVFDLSRP
jgi:class 3 adenylate cyclase